MIPFTPKNWYWVVNNSTTQVYSSAVNNYVPVADAAYVAWLAGGGRAARIASEADLGEALTPYRLRPTAAGVLDGYLSKQAQDVVDMTQFKIMFNHENRIRTIERALAINGSPPNLTPAQARNAVKALM